MKKLYIVLIAIFTINLVNAQTFTLITPPSIPFFNSAGLQYYAMTTDKNSKMWICTKQGISKFDGVNWVNYDTSYNYALNKHITCISIDDNNNIWIGTYHNGIIKFNGINWTNYDSTNSGLSSNYISSIYADSKGNVWIGNSPNNINIFKISKFDGVNWSTYNCTYSILSITEERGDYGVIWFASKNDILKYNQGNWTVYNSSNTYNYIGGTCIAVDHTNNVWASNYFKGTINKFNGTNWINYSDSGLCMNKPYVTTSVFVVDEFNIKWFPNQTLFGPNIVTLYKDTTWINDTILNNNICLSTVLSQGMVIDSIGNKWIITASNGLLKMDCYLPAIPTSIIGAQYVYKGQNSVTYTIPPIDYASSYIWTFPNGFVGTSTTNSITVDVGNNAVSGIIKVYGHSNCGNGNPSTINVTVTPMGIDEEYLFLTNTKIYPNPAKDKLTIETNLNSKINYVVENLLGQNIYSSFVTNKTTIDVSLFPKGIYILKLITDKGIVVKKFVKE